MFFFDSHGGLWATCEANHPEAEAFGPRGCARVARPAEAGLETGRHESPWTTAAREGSLRRAEESHEWDHVVVRAGRGAIRVALTEAEEAAYDAAYDAAIAASSWDLASDVRSVLAASVAYDAVAASVAARCWRAA